MALNKNVIYRLKDEEGKAIFIYVETEYSNTYFLKYKINFKEGVITLGRSQDNTIQVENPGISSHHFRLIYRDTQWRVIDNSSTNGTFVNNRKITEMPLKVGDVVYALGTKIIIGINFISINKNDLIKINDHDLKLMNFEKYISDDDYEIDPINYFYRSPRIKRDIQTKKIIIDNPPDNQIGDEMPMMMVIGPSITMGMASLSTGIFAIANAMSTGNISSAAPSIVMSLSMLLGTVMWPIITKRYERKRKREKEQKRQEKYGRYLDHKEKEIADCANEQNVIWNENFPTIENCVQKIINQDDTLFQRNAKQNDFLELRLGLGKEELISKFSILKNFLSG
ncbi:FHA domain-containing protein [Coprobacillaceae bacterium CR2/5/TPMF4]|nr:FHA domain-containing protein [Coprobacillaceae bacterium CR2/5/TPMF4]